MRVLIDASFGRRAPRSGTAVYIARLVSELRGIEHVEVIAVANPRRGAPAGGGLGSARNLAQDLAWAAALPRLARRYGAELIHHPLPARSPGAGVPQLVSVTDLAFERLPEHFAPGYRHYAQLMHRGAARRAAGVICISQSTAADVRTFWGVPDSRITVALLGPGQRLPAVPAAPPGAERFFLYVGDAEPRKNLPVLLEAYARYRSRAARPRELILAGSATADRPGVRLERRPEPTRLAELYRDAVALVHPALHEGFGLTPLEAMGIGTPVLAARSPGITEVCGDAARYADPRDPESFTLALLELDADPSLRRSLSERGRCRAESFTWAQCARAHVAAYSLALK